jgi:hypothetical protein
MSLNSTTIIIRSVGERTEGLCKKLILEQGVHENAINIINEAPFSKAMKVGFEIGIAEKRAWTFCVDADLLLRQGSILKMVQHAEKLPQNVCEIQGFVLDKFFGGPRKGGIHLYRTSLLEKVIKEIPFEGIDIRPETYTLNAMQKNGYPWHTVQELVGLHDFEQSFEDIFRKCFVQAHKHLNLTELFISYWRNRSLLDSDYKIALVGFSEGIKHFGNVRIDKKAAYFLDSMRNLDLILKDDIELNDWDLDRVENIISNWEEPYEYWKYFPTGMLVTKGNGLSKVFQRYKWFRKSRSATMASKLIMASAFKSMSNRLGR